MEKDEKILRTYRIGQYILIIMLGLLTLYFVLFERGYDYKSTIQRLMVVTLAGIIVLVLDKWLGMNKGMVKLKFWTKKWNQVIAYIIFMFLVLFSLYGAQFVSPWGSDWGRHTLVIFIIWSILYVIIFNIILTIYNRKNKCQRTLN